MPKNQCYNCHKELENKETTREHIPARNLFAGYDEKYKVNRITVSACAECNGKYSPTDEEFRNMIGIISKRLENKTITEKSVRSLQRKDPQQDRLYYNGFNKVSGVKFGENTIEDFHKKNFKGLFLYQYGKVLPDNYELLVHIDENDWSTPTQAIIGYLTVNFIRKVSGHSDIFHYVIQPFRDKLNNPQKGDLIPDENEPAFIGLLTYNETHTAMIIALDQELMNKKREERQKEQSGNA